MDPLIEIRSTVTIRASEFISNSQFISTPSAVSHNSQRNWKSKSVEGAKFYGPNTKLKCDRGEVDSPLVYVCKGIQAGTPDASVIESGLPVSRTRDELTPELPYWPSYRGASPAQRSLYVDWLISGRSDPEVPIGYIFIYFYGLERRVLVDRADFTAVASEILRLLKIYSRSRSFVRYATRLLWTAVWLALKHEGIPRKLFNNAIGATNWNDETLAICLACVAQLQAPIPVELAYHLAANDIRSPRSVIVQRHSEFHREAFTKRFREQFPDGFRLKSAKRARRLEYFAASATLGRLHDNGGPLFDERVPNVIGITSQFQPLIDIWIQTIDVLKAYDRAHRKSGGAAFTTEMFEALPDDLRQGDHPHFSAWYEVMKRYVTEDGWTVVPIQELARIEGVEERARLTKSQSVQLASTATHMGLALEPDSRISGQSYSWDELISVFPATEELSQDVASYHAAAVLLELGVAVAAADGQIDEMELGRLTSHIESQFELSTQDTARLEHLRYVLAKQPPNEFSAARSLQRNLTVEQRRLVGEFLVGIAAADEEITPVEAKALGRAYRSLGLEAADLDRLLRSAVVPAGKPGVDVTTEGFHLDLSRINMIMAETAKVTEFLRDALRDDFATESEAPQPKSESTTTLPDTDSQFPQPAAQIAESESTPTDSQLSGLSPRYLTFATAVLQRGTWSRPALDGLARKTGLMPGAAIEAINEWAYESHGDALLVETESGFDVQIGLLT